RFGESRFPLLRAYTLQAALAGRSLDLIDLAYPELRIELKKTNSHYDSRDVREFKENVGALLPWHQLWANVLVGLIPHDRLGSALADTRSASSKAASITYGEEPYTSDETACLWFDILVQADSGQASHIEDFNRWIASLKRSLYTSTITHLARLAARQGTMEQQSLGYAS